MEIVFYVRHYTFIGILINSMIVGTNDIESKVYILLYPACYRDSAIYVMLHLHIAAVNCYYYWYVRYELQLLCYLRCQKD